MDPKWVRYKLANNICLSWNSLHLFNLFLTQISHLGDYKVVWEVKTIAGFRLPQLHKELWVHRKFAYQNEKVEFSIFFRVGIILTVNKWKQISKKMDLLGFPRKTEYCFFIRAVSLVTKYCVILPRKNIKLPTVTKWGGELQTDAILLWNSPPLMEKNYFFITS